MNGELGAAGGTDPGHVYQWDSGDRDWQEQANCLDVDPDLFFPEMGADPAEAKAICRDCAVRKECLEYALVNGEKFGIWGGLTERERRRIRRQRAMGRISFNDIH